MHHPAYFQAVKPNLHVRRRSPEFDTMFTTNSLGFRGAEPLSTPGETDVLLDTACRKLCAMEGERGVATVYWHQVLLWIADLADYAERVGNRLRLLIAH